MIMSVTELREFITTSKSDAALSVMLEGVENFIQQYSHNTFIDRTINSVVYPPDVKMGAVEIVRWRVNMENKAGISSETISRHSVTYADQNGQNTIGGYPAALVGFLRPYMKARF